MRIRPLLAILALLAANGRAGDTNTPISLVDRLLAESARIRTMRCEIRRETESGGQSVRSLSRVWFARPDRLRVETVTPEARRIVSDGQAIHKWIEGEERGIRIPLEEAPEVDLVQLRKTPGLADEHLLLLQAYPESPMPPEPPFAERRAYTPPAPHPFTVLSLDATGRLARLEFFSNPAATNRLLRADYGGWKEAAPGIWIPTLQKTEVRGRDGTQASETLRVSNLAVNEPLDPAEFEAARYAGKVRFMSPAEVEAWMRDQK